MDQWKGESRSTYSPVLTVNGSPSSLLLGPKPAVSLITLSFTTVSSTPSPIYITGCFQTINFQSLSYTLVLTTSSFHLFFFFLEPSETTSQLGSLMLLWPPWIILCRAARGILGKLSFQSLSCQNNKCLGLPGIRILCQ